MNSDVNKIIEKLSYISTGPEEQNSLFSWVDEQKQINFLRDNIEDKWLVVYASSSETYMHGVLVPKAATLDFEDLKKWSLVPSHHWGLITTSESVEICSPLENPGSELMKQGEQLIFTRSFEGREGDTNYIEILQKFSQLMEVHFVSSRNSYCKLDENGDLVDLIKIVKFKGGSKEEKYDAVIIDRDLLDRYMMLTNSVMVRTFDFFWFEHKASEFLISRPDNQNTNFKDENIYFEKTTGAFPKSTLYRGIQIIQPQMTAEKLVEFYCSPYDPKKQYATFIAYNLRNDKVEEISCDPNCTVNNFQKSDLPLELSPAFFRAEVLSKYKSDSKKYLIDGRSITCRESWYLKGWDVNEYEQVHAYLVDLRELPYKEQLYWKSFNEEPKGPISERAQKADFLGEWAPLNDPLEKLKRTILDLEESGAPWWCQVSSKTMRKSLTTVTQSEDEWANDLLELNKLVIESLKDDYIRKFAENKGIEIEKEYKSLTLIHKILLSSGWKKEEADKLIKPFRELKSIRDKVKSHKENHQGEAMRVKSLEEHGSYRKHFQNLCSDLASGLKEFSSIFREA